MKNSTYIRETSRKRFITFLIGIFIGTTAFSVSCVETTQKIKHVAEAEK